MEGEFALAELVEVGPEEQGQAAEGDAPAARLGVADDGGHFRGGHLADAGGAAAEAVEEGARDVDVDRGPAALVAAGAPLEAQLHPEDGPAAFQGALFREGAEDAEGRGEGQADRDIGEAEGLAVALGDVGELGGAGVDVARVAGRAARDLEDAGDGEVVELLDHPFESLKADEATLGRRW